MDSGVHWRAFESPLRSRVPSRTKPAILDPNRTARRGKMHMLNRPLVRPIALTTLVLALVSSCLTSQSTAQSKTTRMAVVGLDHDHVWELLRYMAGEPDGELVAIAEKDPELVEKARSKVATSVRFFPDYVSMFDEAKPE